MKKVSAIIKPFKLSEVRDALCRIGIPGMTISEVKGFGRQRGHTELYRGAEYVIEFLPKVKIEAIIPSEMLESVLTTIERHARTGRQGDGKIWVEDVGNIVAIRSGDITSPAVTQNGRKVWELCCVQCSERVLAVVESLSDHLAEHAKARGEDSDRSAPLDDDTISANFRPVTHPPTWA